MSETTQEVPVRTPRAALGEAAQRVPAPYDARAHAEGQIDNLRDLRLLTRENAVDLLTVMLQRAFAQGEAKQIAQTLVKLGARL